MMSEIYKGIIVSHSHWDREWYLSFQEFRRWLVLLIDDLLCNLPKNPEFKCFTLDGQTVLLEDYLEIRPERKDELINLIKQGRIIVGPFYVLSDEFLESGEGMIRNLLLGHKIAKQMGAEPLKVGYVPDTFGHIWQMLQILNGFNIKYMYYFRGYPPLFGNWEEYKDKNEDTPLEHFYMAPDGTKILTLHHILGYSNASSSCDNPKIENEFPYANALRKIKTTLKKTAPRTASSLILLMNGDDHAMAEWAIPDLIEKWNDKNNERLLKKYPLFLEHGSLIQYFQELESQVDKGLALPIISGEARGSAYTQVTPGILSTRMNLKLMNWKCARELEKYAEPFSTLSRLFGAQDQGAYIEIAWKWLIKNHPHDSICGCSIDRVHEDMITRFNECLDLASDIFNNSCAAILSGINRQQLIENIIIKFGSAIKEKDVQILGLFNPNAFSGPFIAEGYVNLNLNRAYQLYDYDGNNVMNFHVQYISDYRACGKEGQYLYKKFQNNWTLGKITALIENAPACGYKIYYLVCTYDAPNIEEPETIIPDSIRTEYFIVSFNANGSINIEDLQTKHLYRNLNVFEDTADDGDEYDYGPLCNDKTLYTRDTKATFQKITDNDVFTEIQADLKFNIPYELIENSNNLRSRSEQGVYLNITSNYRIYKRILRIDVKTKVENIAKSHRFRVVFPTDIEAKYSYADDHFMAMKRSVNLPKDDGWFQNAQGIYHKDTFVEICDEKRGLAIFSQGSCEFEIVETPKTFNQVGHSIALTLYRSIGWLSKQDHLGRKSGLNGPNLQTPGAQLMNHQFEFNYAIFPHAGNWKEGESYLAAYSYNYPPRWFSERHYLRNENLSNSLPLELSLVKITNPQIVLSIIKQSEKIMGAKEGIIVRVFNPTETPQETDIILAIPIKELSLTNLLEQDQEFLTLDELNKIRLTISPYKIITLRIKI
jgi:alpha-mannosidase